MKGQSGFFEEEHRYVRKPDSNTKETEIWKFASCCDHGHCWLGHCRSCPSCERKWYRRYHSGLERQLQHWGFDRLTIRQQHQRKWRGKRSFIFRERLGAEQRERRDRRGRRSKRFCETRGSQSFQC